MSNAQKRTYRKSDCINFLVDSLGYSEGECKDMDYQEMLWTINDSGNLYSFQQFTK